MLRLAKQYTLEMIKRQIKWEPIPLGSNAGKHRLYSNAIIAYDRRFIFVFAVNWLHCITSLFGLSQTNEDIIVVISIRVRLMDIFHWLIPHMYR
jgi:hypothetical protein